MASTVIKHVRRIYGHFHAYRWYFLLVFCLSLAYSLLAGLGLSAFIPLFRMTDEAGGSGNSRIERLFQWLFDVFQVDPTATVIVGLILCLLVLRWILYAIAQYLIETIIADYKKQTVNSLFEKLLRTKWEYFQNQNKGSLLDYLTTRIVRIRRLFSVITQLLVSYTVALGYLLVALLVSVPMTIGAVVLSGVSLFCMVHLAGKTKEISRRGVDSQNQVARLLSEFLNAFREIKIYNTTGSVYSRIKSYTERNAGAERKVGIIRKLSQETFHFVIAVTIVIGVYVSLTVYEVPFTHIGAVAFLFLLMFQRLNKMDKLQRIAELSPSIDVLEEFSADLEAQVEVPVEVAGERKQEEGIFNDRIEVDSVSYHYNSDSREPDTWAVRNMDLEIVKGDIIAIVGKSGAGKSTLIGLLLGLLTPDKGQICVDGVPLNNLNIRDWRLNVAYVPQEPFLLNDTILENIRFFRGIPREDLLGAARMSHAHEFITETPNGYDTVIGEEGVKLSGGQRQRLVFARAIAGDPELLVLDEPTSELDSISEEHIRRSLLTLREEVTIVTVSHRLSTVMDADCIHVLQDGEIVESGTQRELEEARGPFYELHHSM